MDPVETTVQKTRSQGARLGVDGAWPMGRSSLAGNSVGVVETREALPVIWPFHPSVQFENKSSAHAW